MNVTFAKLPTGGRYFGLHDFRKFGLPYVAVGFGLFAVTLTLERLSGGEAVRGLRDALASAAERWRPRVVARDGKRV